MDDEKLAGTLAPLKPLPGLLLPGCKGRQAAGGGSDGRKHAEVIAIPMPGTRTAVIQQILPCGCGVVRTLVPLSILYRIQAQGL